MQFYVKCLRAFYLKVNLCTIQILTFVLLFLWGGGGGDLVIMVHFGKNNCYSGEKSMC